MNFTSGALQQLAYEAVVIRQRADVAPVNVQQACRQLSDTLLALRHKGAVVRNHPTKLDAERVWSKFAAARFELSALSDLEIRTLCCVTEIALRHQLVKALERRPETLRRSRCLYGMVNSYFWAWRTMESPISIEVLLTSAFASYRGKNPVVLKWWSNKALFSERAVSMLTEEVCSGQKAIDEVLSAYYVGPLSKLSLDLRASVVKSACEHLRRMETSRDDEWSLSYLQWITERVLSELTPSDAFSESVASLILSESAKRSERFQRALRSYIQSHKRLGDPRVRECALNWRAISPEAAQRYLSWLARDSIIFFFNTILPNNNENRRRKEFWLRYHDRIKDFQVALSEADVSKVKSSQASSDLLHYSRIDHPSTSAFLMKFQGYSGNHVVVEFSETGNAAYVFRAVDFEKKGVDMRTSRFDLKRDLKFDDTHRIVHRGAWEYYAAQRLSSDFGIQP